MSRKFPKWMKKQWRRRVPPVRYVVGVDLATGDACSCWHITPNGPQNYEYMPNTAEYDNQVAEKLLAMFADAPLTEERVRETRALAQTIGVTYNEADQCDAKHTT